MRFANTLGRRGDDYQWVEKATINLWGLGTIENGSNVQMAYLPGAREDVETKKYNNKHCINEACTTSWDGLLSLFLSGLGSIMQIPHSDTLAYSSSQNNRIMSNFHIANCIPAAGEEKCCIFAVYRLISLWQSYYHEDRIELATY